MIFQARDHTITFPRNPLIMGIVNVTPDSFSDGGKFLQTDAAVEQAKQLIKEGAEIIDIGGESTRPNATPVSEPEELRRVIPVIEALSSQSDVLISIDTVKPTVARAALAAGASIVNDIAANRNDPGLWQEVAHTGAGYIAMHMQGSPQNMQDAPTYDDVVTDISAFFDERLTAFQRHAIRPEQVVLDVGIGFGKTLEHNLQLLAGLQRFTKWERPLLIGVSRKSFIGKLTGITDPAERLPGSIACSCWAVQEGANIVRTHDVAATRQALALHEAIIARHGNGNSGHTEPAR